MLSRRRVIIGGAAATGLVVISPALRSATRRLADTPFTLGVSSGFPSQESVVLWTRLAPKPLLPDGGMQPTPVPVRWFVARDERFRRIVARGEISALPANAHSARVSVSRLEAGRDYWYRFEALGHQSRVGRTRTLPSVSAATLRMAVGSCQHYEHGQYAALRHIAEEAPDVMLHLGDYIYEGSPSRNATRAHTPGRCYSLADYRMRYAQYLLDPHLQAAHAACPWLATWDDHEVANDYSAIHSGLASEDPAAFLARRNAAYQAYFEHLPLPSESAPHDGETRIYARRSAGNFATIHMLDQRQYRSAQACPQGNRNAGNRLTGACTERLLPSRTMLGAEQEAWFEQGLVQSPAQWTVIAQGVVMSHIDEEPENGGLFWSDAWNGYPAARAKVLAALTKHRSGNPIVLSGDLHAFLVGHINTTPENPQSPGVAVEFTTTSLTSSGRPQAGLDAWRKVNPNLSLLDGRQRGYLRLTLKPQLAVADLMVVDDIQDAASKLSVLKSYAVESGRSEVLGG